MRRGRGGSCGSCSERSGRCASAAESPTVVTPGEAPTVLGTLPRSPRCLLRAPFGSSHPAPMRHNRSPEGQHQGTSCSHPLRAHTRRTQPFTHPTCSSPTASPPCSSWRFDSFGEFSSLYRHILVQGEMQRLMERGDPFLEGYEL